MGGNTPLGYRPDGRTLAIVEEHAQLIRELFRRYLQTGNVRVLTEQLGDEGITVPERSASTGRKMGGVPFTRGQIYKILSNPIYVGEIHHNGKVFEGQHEAIIERQLWDEVQARLAANRQGVQRAATVKSASLFAGKIVDDDGRPLVASHACKGEARYRYYISKTVDAHPATGSNGYRLPAMELEKVVCEHLANEVRKPLSLISMAGLVLSPDQMSQLSSKATRLADRLAKRDRFVVRQLVEEIRIGRDAVTVDLKTARLAAELGIDMPSLLHHHSSHPETHRPRDAATAG